MSEKHYQEMTDGELTLAMEEWGKRVDSAAGWTSAYFAAKQCASIEREAKVRRISIENRWPIRRGEGTHS